MFNNKKPAYILIRRIIAIVLLVSFIVTSSDTAFALAPSGKLDDRNFQQAFSALDSSTRALDAIGESLYLKISLSGVREMVERRAGTSLPISVTSVENGAVFFSFLDPQGKTKDFKCFLSRDNISPVGATLLKLPDGREYWREEIGLAGQLPGTASINSGDIILNSTDRSVESMAGTSLKPQSVQAIVNPDQKAQPGYSMKTGRTAIISPIPSPLADQARSEILVASLGLVMGVMASAAFLEYPALWGFSNTEGLHYIKFWLATSTILSSIVVINVFFSRQAVTSSQRLYKKIESLIFDMHKKEVLDNKNTLDLLKDALYEHSEFSQKAMVRKLCTDKNTLIRILENPTFRNISRIFKIKKMNFTKKQIRAIRDQTIRRIDMVKTVDPFYFSSTDNHRSIIIALKFARAFSLSVTKKMCALFLLRHLRRIAEDGVEWRLASLGISPEVWGEAKVILQIKGRIKAILEEAAASGSPHYVYITGDSKVGKTTFMKLMEEAGLDSGRNRIAFINMDKVYEENDPDMELGGEAALGIVTRKLAKDGKVLFVIDGRDAHLLNAGDSSNTFFIHITADDETRLENIIRTDFGVSALWSYSQVPEGGVLLNLSRNSRPNEAEIYSIFSGKPVIHFPKFMKVMIGAWIAGGLVLTHVYSEPSLSMLSTVTVILYVAYLAVTDGIVETVRRMIEETSASKMVSDQGKAEANVSILSTASIAGPALELASPNVQEIIKSRYPDAIDVHIKDIARIVAQKGMIDRAEILLMYKKRALKTGTLRIRRDGDMEMERSKIFADIDRMDLMFSAYQEILSERGKGLRVGVAGFKKAFTEGDYSRIEEAKAVIARMPDPQKIIMDENDPENWINWFDLKDIAVLHMPLGYGCRMPCQQCLAGNGVFLSRNLPLPIAIKAIKPHNFGNWSRNELFDWYDPFFRTSIDSLMEYAIRKDDTAHFIITTAGWPKWDRRAQEAAERINDFDINPTLGTSGFNVSFHLGQPYYDIVRATYERAKNGGSMTELTEEELSLISAPYVEHYANILSTLSPHLRHIYFCYTKEPSFYNLVSTYAFKKALEKADWNSFDLTVNVTRSIEGVEPDDTREFLVYQDLHDAESDEAIGRSVDFLKRLELAEKGDPACLKVDPVVITDRIAPKTKYPLVSISHNGDVKVESHIDGRVLARTSIEKSDSHFLGQASSSAGYDERFEMKGDGGDTSEEDLNRLDREAAKPPAAAEPENIPSLIPSGDAFKRIIKSIGIVASAILVLYLHKDWYLALAQASSFWRISENLVIGGISCGLGMYVNQTIRGERYDWGKIARWTVAGGVYLGLIVYGGWFWFLTTYMPNIFWRVFVDVTLFFAIVGLPINFFIHKYIVSLNKEKVDWRQTLSHSLRLYAFHCVFWGIGLYIGWSYFEEQIVLVVAALSIVWRGVFIYFLDSWVKTAHGPPNNSGDTKEKEKSDSHFSGQASLPDGYDKRFEMKGDGGDTSEEDLKRLGREAARAATEDVRGATSYNESKERIRLYLSEGSDDRIDDIIKSIDFSIKTEDSAYMIAATFDILGTLPEEKKTQERLLILSEIIRQADPASEKPADNMAREAAIAFFKTVDESRQFQEARDKELAAIEFIKGGGRRQGAAESYDLKVKTFGLLTRVGEICLASRARLGDSSAVNKLIETNLGLVESIAGKYLWSGIEFLDLVSAGNSGLCRAIEKYDPSKGNKFSTYAKWWIKATIHRWIDNYGRNIRIPVPVLGKLEAFRKACRDHIGQNGVPDPIDRFDEDISNKKLAEAIDWPEETVTEMRRIMYRSQSLSDPRTGSDDESENRPENTREGTIGEFNKGLEDFEKEDLLEYIAGEVKKVYEVRRKDWNERARIVFEDRILPIFWLEAPITCDEVAKKLGVTPQYVSLIEMRLKRAMRRVLEKEGLTSVDFIGRNSNDRLINDVKEKSDSHFLGQPSVPDGYDERFEMKGDGGDTSEEDLDRLELEAAAKPLAAEIVKQIKETSWMGAINLKDAGLEVRRAVLRGLNQLEIKELTRVGALLPGWEPNRAFRLLSLFPGELKSINNDAVEIIFSREVMLGIGQDLQKGPNVFRIRVEDGAASLSILNKDGSEIANRPLEFNSKKPYIIARSIPKGDPYRIMIQDSFVSSKKHFAFKVVKDGGQVKLLLEDESTNGTCISIPGEEKLRAPAVVLDKKAEPGKHIVIVRKGLVAGAGSSQLDSIVKRKGPVQPGDGDTAWEMVAGMVSQNSSSDLPAEAPDSALLIAKADSTTDAAAKIIKPVSREEIGTFIDSAESREEKSVPVICEDGSILDIEMEVFKNIARRQLSIIARRESGGLNWYEGSLMSEIGFGNRHTAMAARNQDTAQAETLANKIKIYASEAKREKAKVIVGIETSGWVPDEQKSDMQALSSEVRQLVDTLKRRGALNNISVVLGNSETLLSNIVKEQSGKSDKIVVLGSEKTLTSDSYKTLEAFKACVDLRELGNLNYISLLEMLTVALNLGLGGETGADSLMSHPDIAIETIGERIVRLIPSKRIDINEPSKIYQLQIKELAKQA